MKLLCPDLEEEDEQRCKAGKVRKRSLLEPPEGVWPCSHTVGLDQGH